MTKEAAEFIKAAYDLIGDYDVKIMDDYSGRGMFGKTTYALTMEHIAINDMLDVVTKYIKDEIRFTNVDARNFVNAIPDFSNFRTDSMGMGIVVY